MIIEKKKEYHCSQFGSHITFSKCPQYSLKIGYTDTSILSKFHDKYGKWTFIQKGILSYGHLISGYNLSSFYVCEILVGNEYIHVLQFGKLIGDSTWRHRVQHQLKPTNYGYTFNLCIV